MAIFEKIIPFSLILGMIVLLTNAQEIPLNSIQKSAENFNKYLQDKEFSFKKEIMIMIEGIQKMQEIKRKHRYKSQPNICIWKICSRPLKENYKPRVIQNKKKPEKINKENILIRVFHRFH